MTPEMKAVHETLFQQWQDMLSRGIMPIIEQPIKGDGGETEHLTVTLTLFVKTEEPNTNRVPYGLYFSGDFEKDVHFSGDIKKHGDMYYLPIDEIFSDLDYYLQMVSDEVTEGYILPNDLFVG